MRLTSNMRQLRSATLLVGLGACTLTSNEVEPEPPREPVGGKPTVVYRLDGLPVVANNSVRILSFSLPPVYATLDDSTLVLSAVDDQSSKPPAPVRHDLLVRVPRFRGVGTYANVQAELAISYLVSGSSPSSWSRGPSLTLAPGVTPRFTVTEWSFGSNSIRGTFEFTFREPTGVDRRVTEGWFFSSFL